MANPDDKRGHYIVRRRLSTNRKPVIFFASAVSISTAVLVFAVLVQKPSVHCGFQVAEQREKGEKVYEFFCGSTERVASKHKEEKPALPKPILPPAPAPMTSAPKKPVEGSRSAPLGNSQRHTPKNVRSMPLRHLPAVKPLQRSYHALPAPAHPTPKPTPIHTAPSALPNPQPTVWLPPEQDPPQARKPLDLRPPCPTNGDAFCFTKKMPKPKASPQ